MKSTKQLFGLLLASSWLGAAAVSGMAQGTAFTYQGQLKSNGTNATGSYDLTFALYNAASGGAQVGSTLTSTGQRVTNGQFTVVLDYGSVFNGTAYWLEIAVRPNGGGSYSTLSPRQQLTPTPYAISAENVTGLVNASQLSGTLPSSSLVGTYGSPVNLNNAGNNFVGNGAGLANVNAASLNGLNSTNFWQLKGNNVAPGQFLGSTNSQVLELRAYNTPALRIEPGTWPGLTNVPNIIGGSPGNFVAPGTVGNVIGGGSSFTEGSTNYISAANYNVIGGGWDNHITNFSFEATIAGGEYNRAGASYATVGGGNYNTANGNGSTVPGGQYNTASGTDSFAAGSYARAAHDGAFVWADDSTSTPFASTFANQFLVRAQFMALNRTNPITGADSFVVGSPATGNYGGMYVDTAGTNGWPFYGYSQGGSANAWTYLDGSDGNKWKLSVASIDQVTVQPNGLVGIGTTTPLAKLEVTNSVGSQSGLTNVGILALAGKGSAGEIPFAYYAGAGTFVGPNGILAVGTTNFSDSFGVVGIAKSSSGHGVHGAAMDTSGGTSYGVYGQTASTNGAGVWAQAANSSSAALAIGTGGIRIAGAGLNSQTAAFIHLATAANTSTYITTITNPLCDGDPNALLFITHSFSPPGVGGNYETHAHSVWYNTGSKKWTIYHDDLTSITNMSFNVLVIKN